MPNIKAQLIESQLEKEVPVKIAPVDEEALEEGKIEEKVKPNEGLKDTQPLSNAEGTEEEEASALSEDAAANAERIETLRTDVEGLKDSLKDTLSSSYKMVLTDDQLKELASKVLSVIASFVTDITVERVEEISGDILKVDDDKKK